MSHVDKLAEEQRKARAKAANNGNKPQIRTWTLAELMAEQFPAERVLVGGVLPTGLTVFHGRAKGGKSVMLTNLAFGLATGGQFLRRKCEQSPVLYLDIEQPPSRAQSRWSTFLGGNLESIPGGLELVFEDEPIPGFFAKGYSALDWLDERIVAGGHGVVIVDVVTKLLPSDERSRGNIYRREYDQLTSLKRWADERHLAMVAVTHPSKSGDGPSGTTAWKGAPDTLWTLERPVATPVGKFVVEGRNVPEWSVEVEFDWRWYSVDLTEEARRNAAFRATSEEVAEDPPAPAPPEPAEPPAQLALGDDGYTVPM